MVNHVEMLAQHFDSVGSPVMIGIYIPTVCLWSTATWGFIVCVCGGHQSVFLVVAGGDLDGASKTLTGVSVDQRNPAGTRFLIAVSSSVGCML